MRELRAIRAQERCSESKRLGESLTISSLQDSSKLSKAPGESLRSQALEVDGIEVAIAEPSSSPLVEGRCESSFDHIEVTPYIAEEPLTAELQGECLQGKLEEQSEGELLGAKVSVKLEATEASGNLPVPQSEYLHFSLSPYTTNIPPQNPPIEPQDAQDEPRTDEQPIKAVALTLKVPKPTPEPRDDLCEVPEQAGRTKVEEIKSEVKVERQLKLFVKPPTITLCFDKELGNCTFLKEHLTIGPPIGARRSKRIQATVLSLTKTQPSCGAKACHPMNQPDIEDGCEKSPLAASLNLPSENVSNDESMQSEEDEWAIENVMHSKHAASPTDEPSDSDWKPKRKSDRILTKASEAPGSDQEDEPGADNEGNTGRIGLEHAPSLVWVLRGPDLVLENFKDYYYHQTKHYESHKDEEEFPDLWVEIQKFWSESISGTRDMSSKAMVGWLMTCRDSFMQAAQTWCNMENIHVFGCVIYTGNDEAAHQAQGREADRCCKTVGLSYYYHQVCMITVGIKFSTLWLLFPCPLLQCYQGGHTTMFLH
ncbi:hypothetical protein F5141DRAFT_1062238 [Pisolithus sp. B1]|nr:hypothetical protein F5141DRAFT_1062238 [Pisolithus sp. B1]